MFRKIVSVLLVSILASCGGGGGGGGSPSPSNLNPPGGGTPTPDLQTGIFSDSPVAGLRFVQGPLSGYTDAQGQFTYDANQSAPVQFFIGELYLGSAPGAAVVTPFDLSINGTPVTLDAGINISRVLISLDSDTNPDNGITLSDATRSAKLPLEFALTVGQFETDPQVNYLLDQYAAGRTLESVADTRSHLSQNVAAQLRIEQLEQAIDTAISRIEIRWNSALVSNGILAHFKANNAEELVLQLAEQDGAWWIRRAIYAGPQGVSRLIEFSQDGNVAYVDNNGAVGKYVQFAEMDVIRFAENHDIYQPKATAYLTTESGLASAQQIHHFHQARIDNIATILQRQQQGQIGLLDQLQLGEHFMSLVNSVSCAGVASCTYRSPLLGALSRALEDSHYRDTTVSTRDEALDDQLCLRALLNPASTPCQANQTLAVLLLQSGNRVQSLRNREGDFVVRLEKSIQGSLGSSSFLDQYWAIREQRPLPPWTHYKFDIGVTFELVRLSNSEWLQKISAKRIFSEHVATCEIAPKSNGVYDYQCSQSVAPALAEGYRNLLHSEFSRWLRHSAVLREMQPVAASGVRTFCLYPYTWGSNKAFKVNTCTGTDASDLWGDELIDHEKTEALNTALRQPVGNGIQMVGFSFYASSLYLSPAVSTYPWSADFHVKYHIIHPMFGWLEVSFHD